MNRFIEFPAGPIRDPKEKTSPDRDTMYNGASLSNSAIAYQLSTK